MMKYLLILFFILISTTHARSLFLKLDGETIVGHDYNRHDDYTTEIPETRLVNSNAVYKYKYSNGRLIELTQVEINNHPLEIARKARINNRDNKLLRLKELREWNCGTEVGFAKKYCEYLKL